MRHGVGGAILALLSTFVGARSAKAIYPDILGCEAGCDVVATGWPLVFVYDYPGLSVVNTADMMEVWLRADRFVWTPFAIDAGLWSLAIFAADAGFRWFRRRSSATQIDAA